MAKDCTGHSLSQRLPATMVTEGSQYLGWIFSQIFKVETFFFASDAITCNFCLLCICFQPLIIWNYFNTDFLFLCNLSISHLVQMFYKSVNLLSMLAIFNHCGCQCLLPSPFQLMRTTGLKLLPIFSHAIDEEVNLVNAQQYLHSEWKGLGWKLKCMYQITVKRVVWQMN